MKEKDKTFVEIEYVALVARLSSPTPKTRQFSRVIISVT